MKKQRIPITDLSELPEEQCDEVLLNLFNKLSFYSLYKHGDELPTLIQLFQEEYESKKKNFENLKQWYLYDYLYCCLKKEDEKRTARYDIILNKLQTYQNCRFPEKCRFAYALADVFSSYRKEFNDLPENNTRIIQTLLTRLQKESNANGVASIYLTDQIRILGDRQRDVCLAYEKVEKQIVPKVTKDVIRKRLGVFWKRWSNKINKLPEEERYQYYWLIICFREAYTDVRRRVKRAATSEARRIENGTLTIKPRKRRRRR